MAMLYTPMKVFHYPDKLASLSRTLDHIEPPLHIRIKPTNVCNHHCWYCAYRAEGMQLGQDMKLSDAIPEAKMEEILDDIIEMGVKAVTFSGGGEPLCYPGIKKAAAKLAGSPVKFATLTNGSRLAGETAELFARHATWVRVSMDGWDDESYTQYRGAGPGEFSRIMKNMRDFKKVGGKCLLGVSLIIDRRNGPHAYDLIGQYKDIGVDTVKISPCIVSNNGAESQQYHDDIFDQVRSEVERIKSDFQDDGFEIHDSYHRLNLSFQKEYTWCPYLQILSVIGADQRVYSCQDKAYNLESGCLGSISDQRFKDFWFEDKQRFFQINPKNHCSHHCVSHFKNELIHGYLSPCDDHLNFV